MQVKVATRGSKLALTQTGLAIDALRAVAKGAQIEKYEIVSTGDMKQGTPRARQSDKRDWIHELECAVVDGSAEIAIHSGKDIPSEIAKETILVPILKRENPFDVFIGKKSGSRRIKLSEVPKNGVLGSASLRRRAQLLMHRSDFSVVEHRGNVPTRIEKLDNSETLSGIILAHAGILRLGFTDLEVEEFSTDIMLPAINQGILVAQVRADRSDVISLLNKLIDPDADNAFKAERGCADILKGDCNSAISMFADMHSGKLRMRARVLLPDGSKCLVAEQSGDPKSAKELGLAVGEELLSKGAATLLEASKEYCSKTAI